MNTLSSTEFYNRLASVFDVMTDWPARLAFEMPFLQGTLERYGARRVLDVACGTGWHAIALAQQGYTTIGCDASPAMIERARANAAQTVPDQHPYTVHFEVADFAHLNECLAETEDSPTVDAILCLGNSLPHLLSQAALLEALRQMRALLRPGGVLILHNLNYDLRLKTQPRFFAANGDAETVVWRFADYGSPGELSKFITFHTALFERGANGWSVNVNSTLQRPLLARDLDDTLTQAGFGEIQHFGGLDGSAFDVDTSSDLVVVAKASVRYRDME